MPGVRHLHPTQVESALRRGSQVEQLLSIDSGDRAIGIVRWLSLSLVRDRFELRLHEAEDVGSIDFADIAAFPSADPEDEFGEGRLVASSPEASEILDAASGFGAAPDRWVNQGVVGNEALLI